MNAVKLHALIVAVCEAVIADADTLTALDQAIGDGDHGLNMKRGCEAVLADAQLLAAKPLPDALKAIGTTLVMKIGGASGPLYGTLFMALGKEVSAEPSLADFGRAYRAAIDAVKARGKSETGQKTMLDVLVPVDEALRKPGMSAGTIKRAAAEAAKATVPMLAIRGRASFLGERSIGHMDPGARSASVMIATICEGMA